MSSSNTKSIKTNKDSKTPKTSKSKKTINKSINKKSTTKKVCLVCGNEVKVRDFRCEECGFPVPMNKFGSDEEKIYLLLNSIKNKKMHNLIISNFKSLTSLKRRMIEVDHFMQQEILEHEIKNNKQLELAIKHIIDYMYDEESVDIQYMEDNDFENFMEHSFNTLYSIKKSVLNNKKKVEESIDSLLKVKSFEETESDFEYITAVFDMLIAYSELALSYIIYANLIVYEALTYDDEELIKRAYDSVEDYSKIVYDITEIVNYEYNESRCEICNFRNKKINNRCHGCGFPFNKPNSREEKFYKVIGDCKNKKVKEKSIGNLTKLMITREDIALVDYYILFSFGKQEKNEEKIDKALRFINNYMYDKHNIVAFEFAAKHQSKQLIHNTIYNMNISKEKLTGAFDSLKELIDDFARFGPPSLEREKEYYGAQCRMLDVYMDQALDYVVYVGFLLWLGSTIFDDEIIQLIVANVKDYSIVIEQIAEIFYMDYDEGNYAVQEKEENFTCGDCGKVVDKDATECPYCGAKFIDDNDDSDEEEFTCGGCGKIVDEDATECPYCGVKFI